MKNNLLSIIIPIYNCKDSLNALLDSIMSLKFENYEIIIIDDGSTDGLKKLENKYKKNARIIRQKNSGVSVARNNGIQNASGKYIIFADADDTVNYEIINNMYDELINNEYNLILFNYSTVNENKNVVNVGLKNIINYKNVKEMFFHTLNLGVYWMAVWNKLYKTNIVKKISFDSSYYNGEDFDFNIKYLKEINFQGVKIVNKSIYNYNICQGEFKYRQNSVNTRLKIYKELKELDSLNESSAKINHYFWNSIFYDLIALYKTDKLNVSQKKLELNLLMNDKSVRKIYIPKTLSSKKRLLIKMIKINPYFGYKLIGKLKK